MGAGAFAEASFGGEKDVEEVRPVRAKRFEIGEEAPAVLCDECEYRQDAPLALSPASQPFLQRRLVEFQSGGAGLPALRQGVCFEKTTGAVNQDAQVVQLAEDLLELFQPFHGGSSGLRQLDEGLEEVAQALAFDARAVGLRPVVDIADGVELSA